MPVVVIKSGREKSLQRKHPWIFSGAIARIDGEPENGETVRVVNSEGSFLAWGAHSRSSQIAVRIWSWDEKENVDEKFLISRLSTAVNFRSSHGLFNQTNSLRLVHSESDGLPGLVVDQYADTLVVQFLSVGVEHWRNTIINILEKLTNATRIFERSDVDVRRLEGLDEKKGLLYGPALIERIRVVENGLEFWVDIKCGQKTGFYLDQRQNRARLRNVSKGKRVLDCFCYTGGFSVNALFSGAEAITAVDSSAEVLEIGKENIALNKLNPKKVEWVKADVFHILRRFRDQDRRFDLIVLDPPKFAPTKAHAHKASRGYKDINLLALKLLNPGGLLMTFSCSSGISVDLFQKILAGAALDAGIPAQIIERYHQAEDHPVALNFPEGEYLKGFLIRVLD